MLSTSSIVYSTDKVSPVGAGFVGAGVTFTVVCAMLAGLYFLGFLTIGKRPKANKVEYEVGFIYLFLDLGVLLTDDLKSRRILKK